MRVTIMPVGLLGTNCYLLASEAGNCAVIDPGAQPDKIAGMIRAKGFTPKMILVTHGHHDHVGGLKKLLGSFDAPVYIGEGDLDRISGNMISRSVPPEDAQEYVIPGAIALTDGQELVLDELAVKVVTTPGHTPGGVCYLCGEIMFSGDTLFLGDIGRCDLPGGDYGVMKQSLKKLCGLPGDYTVYPGHGEATTLSYERKNNRYINE